MQAELLGTHEALLWLDSQIREKQTAQQRELMPLGVRQLEMWQLLNDRQRDVRDDPKSREY